ncbi:MAG: glycogen debranching enzyme N-terminal domain-containing protein [Desulfovibrionaceae bacterium]|jgi:predicted glycogen debranching enzyme|nr:glycogen debranching enzyme N-terminal domain-containing protein [Desulfovibrionaceae bacterium]
MTRFDRQACVNTEVALRAEWLDTNGLGGYASSTILGCHTRKYHGLLVAALDNPKGRFVLLSKLEEVLVIDGREFHLSTNKYPGVFHPTGHKYVQEVEQDLWVSKLFRIGDVLLRKSVLMVQGENTVLVCYELLQGPARRPAPRSAPPAQKAPTRTPVTTAWPEPEHGITLQLAPLLAFRSIHALTRENMALRPKTFPERNGCKIEPYEGLPPLHMGTNRRSMFYPGPKWYKNFEYLKELRRGFPHQEDLFCPGVFELHLEKGKPVVFGASVAPLGQLERKRKTEIARREAELERCAARNAHLARLKYYAGQFLITNTEKMPSVIAGYHWFGEWGRDTMIALPGLAFHSGRLEFGARVLAGFAALERDGLLPNFLAQESADAAYNSVDASLWFFWTVQQFLAAGGDRKFVLQRLYPALRSIVAAHLDGRVPLCGLGDDGLLYAGTPDTQLTWMDAKAHGRPVTPRHGAAVEINALFHNALRLFLELAGQAGASGRSGSSAPGGRDADLAGRAAAAAERLATVFVPAFWNNEDGCLCDLVNDRGRDHAIRPNQIFAVSLPHSMLDEEQMRAVVRTVQAHLLTPYGLRTLSPRSPDYVPFYEGGPDQRDAAYHQGMVWPWLSCHFAEALLRQAHDRAGATAFLKKHFKPILAEFPLNFGITSIPEIYNGNPPYIPKGAIAQAWSVAEAIRLHKVLGGR